MNPLAIAFAVTVAVALLQGGPVATAQTIELKFSHFVPPVHPFHRWTVHWVERIEKESGGRLKVMGNSIAIATSGPMPGRTPTSVPSSTP